MITRYDLRTNVIRLPRTFSAKIPNVTSNDNTFRCVSILIPKNGLGVEKGVIISSNSVLYYPGYLVFVRECYDSEIAIPKNELKKCGINIFKKLHISKRKYNGDLGYHVVLKETKEDDLNLKLVKKVSNFM